MSKKYYVYALIDPKKDEVYYIGKGKNDRIKRHFQKYDLKQNCNPYKCNLIRKRRREGYKPSKYTRIIFNNLTNKKACKLEKDLIGEIGKENLTNLVDGGDGGVLGYEHTEKTKNKISKANTGKKRCDKVKEKISKAASNPSDETKRKMSEAQKRRVISKETREKISKSIRGESHPDSKLNKKQAEEIKWLSTKSNMTQKEIGNRYSISRSTVGKIKNERVWKHITRTKPNIKNNVYKISG